MTNTYTGYGRRSEQTPQSEPIPGSNQVENSAGGFSYAIDDMSRLTRFLVLGSASGTYYIGERKLTKENLDALERLLKAGRGCEVVAKIVEISAAGRAASNDPALFALARCCACDVHGQVSYARPEKTYELHRHHHLELFEQFSDEEVARPLWGGSAVRRGETIFLTMSPASSPVQITHPDDIAVRQAAYAQLAKVARTGTHWLHFVEYEKQFRGRGGAHRRAVRGWYNGKRAKDIAFQVLKYQSRDGWSQRDVLRLARPKPASMEHNAVYRWVTRGWEGLPEDVPAEEALRMIWAFERAKHAGDANEVADLVVQYHLPREAVPTAHLNSVSVWEALLEEMPLEAMTRNLATMTKNGVLAPMGQWTGRVVERLRDREAIKKARLHPIKLLAALLTYSAGRGQRSDATWTPIQQIVDALNDAFYLAFDCIEPTNSRIVLALDVSGSMSSGEVGGVPGLTPRVASSALALVTAATEPNYTIMAFSHQFVPLGISPKQRLDDVTRMTDGMPFGGTDCSLPMTWAMQNKVQADAFVVYTDSETWAGRIHPVQALQQYRQKFGIPAKLIVVGMVSNGFSIADSNDAGMLDVVGFDTATPELISSFVRGDF